MKNIFLFIVCVLSINSFSQTLTDSNLPIAVITTDVNSATSLPFEINNTAIVLGNIKIIKHSDGSRNFITDINTAAFLNCDSRFSIKIRGSSSQATPKKGYSLTTLLANNTSSNAINVLGMPAESDWILNGLAFDPSLIRDYLAYNLSRQMGNYAARTEYCEVVINGEYMGIYLLQEKIKADANRVNITKITATDNIAPNVTGGYITKADKTTGGDPIAWSNIPYSGSDVNYIHDLPKPANVTAQQDTYIHAQFDALSTSATANNSSLLNGFTTTIDVPTFIDFMISNEFAANADGYQLSTYFHKDRNGKLRAGPIWDFNLTWGNDLFAFGYDRSKIDSWQFANGDNEGSKFWKDLFDNSEYKCYLSKRWNALNQAGQPLNDANVNALIDTTIALLQESMVRENQKWNTIQNNALEISNMKTWISDRKIWMTNNIGTFSACNNVVTPPLVISQINYNPVAVTTPTTISSNDQEFIQITNTSNGIVNLSGIYFSQLGTTYQFPYNATIAANSAIYLAANTAVFQSKYGLTAFGQYSRNLSNKSQNIVLSDAFGNVIDTVEYFDAVPWPLAADGLGSYLQLIDNSLDNNLGTNWQASTNNLAAANFNFDTIQFSITPNPANDILNVSSSTKINKIEIIDLYGKILKTENSDSNNLTTNISEFSEGIYLIKLFNEYGVKSEKIIKR